MTNYEEIENLLSDVIKSDNYNAKAYPDNESEFNKNFTIAQVYLLFTGSDFASSENTSAVIQEETLNFDIYFRAKSRRGEKGLLQIVREVSDKILGYKMVGCSKIQFTKQGFMEVSQNNCNYFLSFNFTTHIVENQPEQLTSTFKKIDHVQN